MKEDEDVRLAELTKSEAYLTELSSTYSISHFYDLSIYHGSGLWKIEFALRPLGKMLEKNYKGKLFEDHVEEPRVFVAMHDSLQVGWIELGYEKWNNRMRVWEFLVKEEFRRKGIGTQLMKKAANVAKERGARMLVLETQTCLVPAINFYLKFGFELIGFDATAYSNDDIGKKEVRLELGLKL